MRTSAPRPSLPAPNPIGDDDDGFQVDSLVDAVVEPVFHDDSIVARTDTAPDADVGSHDRRSFIPPGVDPLQRTAAVANPFAPSLAAPRQPGNSSFPTAFDPTPAFVEVLRSAAPAQSPQLGRTIAAYAAMRDRH
ncbi:MAG: hypothetical protein JWO69_1726 [Thermoleophilia bacterium]|nr:hypothetical protein [Thermoleophilia bacterium]